MIVLLIVGPATCLGVGYWIGKTRSSTMVLILLTIYIAGVSVLPLTPLQPDATKAWPIVVVFTIWTAIALMGGIARRWIVEAKQQSD